MRKYGKILLGLLRLLVEYFFNVKRLKLHGLLYCISSGVKIRVARAGFCDLGRKNWFSENCIIESGGKLVFGYNNFFNTNCRIVALVQITIGDNNLFGPNVIIVDHDHRFEDTDKLICEQGFTKAPVKIGSNIWIGGNVTICQGVSIADNVIIGANSVVTKSITESGIYAGIPARKIRSR